MSLKLTKRGRIWYVRGTVRGRSVFETAGTTEREQAEAFRAKREAGSSRPRSSETVLSFPSSEPH